MNTTLYACLAGFFTIVFWISAVPATTAGPQPGQFLHILSSQDKQSEQKKSPLQVVLKEGQTGAMLTLTFTGEQLTLDKGADVAPPGGMYSLTLDGMTFLQESFTGPTLQTEKILPLQAAANGAHTLHCELRYATGKTYQAELPFVFNSAPSVTIEKGEGKQSQHDPTVALNFFNEGQEIVGYLDVAVDERSVATVQIGAQANGGKKTLSQWMEKPLMTASLSQGNHLIKITATSLNGGKTVQFVPFEVETLPGFEVTQSKEGTFEVLTATFQQAADTYQGSLDLFYQQGVILSLQSRETAIFLKKADVISAFAQHKLPLPQQPVSLVVCLRSVNNTENWQVVSFQP